MASETAIITDVLKSLNCKRSSQEKDYDTENYTCQIPFNVKTQFFQRHNVKKAADGL